MEFFTLGVYHSTEEAFFSKLTANNIDTFCDIRQRRGVRGATYAFANSSRLQQKLKALNIQYLHETGLAPTTEIRQLQKEADQQQGGLKRERPQLAPAYISAYKDLILNQYRFNAFLKALEEAGSQKIAFFCVEQNPQACHRSLVTEKLFQLGFKTTHL